MKRQLLGLLAFAMMSPPVLAADVNGDFAIRGAGRLSCKVVLEALETRDQNQLTVLATWVEGYITAQNQLQSETFDALPWQTTELILALSGQSCKQRGDDAQFMDVVGRLLAEMRPIRLTQRSGMVSLNSGDAAQVHYRVTVERARARLVALGYVFEQESVIGQKALDELTRNLTEYQTKSGLPPSGRLDQNTLLNLFVRPQK